MKSPVLILLFNRDRAAKVLEPIRKYRPDRIYLSADGPRVGRSEAARIEEIRREWRRQIDWPCMVRVRFSSFNEGCRAAVSRGIDWFFEHEESGIIIEEDCRVAESFFPFASELLEKYRDDLRITSITAQNEQQGHRRGPESYYFSEIAHCWGWASWRRAWSRYREVEAHLPQIIADGRVFQSSSYPQARTSWARWSTRVLKGDLDSWAIIWSIANLAHHGLSIIPNVNLVENLGFDAEATHTRGGSRRRIPRLEALDFPLVHPCYVYPNTEADAFDYQHCYGWRGDVVRKAKGMVKRALRPVRDTGNRLFTLLATPGGQTAS